MKAPHPSLGLRPPFPPKCGVWKRRASAGRPRLGGRGETVRKSKSLFDGEKSYQQFCAFFVILRGFNAKCLESRPADSSDEPKSNPSDPFPDPFFQAPGEDRSDNMAEAFPDERFAVDAASP